MAFVHQVTVPALVKSRPVEDQETCPLPDDPTLAAIARALNDADYWAIIVDEQWHSSWMTRAGGGPRCSAL